MIKIASLGTLHTIKIPNLGTDLTIKLPCLTRPPFPPPLPPWGLTLIHCRCISKKMRLIHESYIIIETLLETYNNIYFNNGLPWGPEEFFFKGPRECYLNWRRWPRTQKKNLWWHEPRASAPSGKSVQKLNFFADWKLHFKRVSDRINRKTCFQQI